MKITDIKTYLVEAHRRNWVFIEVETDEGITGVGEATIEPFERTMVTLIEDYKRTVIGKDPRRIEWLWEDRYRGQFLRSDLLVNVALSAIEIACWDIKGKAVGVPCYELFGGPYPSIPVAGARRPLAFHPVFPAGLWRTLAFRRKNLADSRIP